MNIVEFFDPYNIDHIKAYAEVMETGQWPESFVPEDVTFNPCWSVDLLMKMTEAWVESVKNDKIQGFPPYNG